MCDEKKFETWAKDRLSRRDFGALASIAAVSACASEEVLGSSSEAGSANSSRLVDEPVSFATEDGTMDARFFAGPDGPAPAVIHWPDIAGIGSRRSTWRSAQPMLVMQSFWSIPITEMPRE